MTINHSALSIQDSSPSSTFSKSLSSSSYQSFSEIRVTSQNELSFLSQQSYNHNDEQQIFCSSQDERVFSFFFYKIGYFRCSRRFWLSFFKSFTSTINHFYRIPWKTTNTWDSSFLSIFSTVKTNIYYLYSRYGILVVL